VLGRGVGKRAHGAYSLSLQRAEEMFELTKCAIFWEMLFW